MGNYDFRVRLKRWVKFSKNALFERLHGLDFSTVYVDNLHRSTAEFHGYSMTDGDDMKRMLQALPIEPGEKAFLDVGCGKGMCMKCAAELGYRKVSGLDLDEHLLGIARKNMKKLEIDADCLLANAAEFNGYAAYDVFYFYNPFGPSIFRQVIQQVIKSQFQRTRDIWVVYYHPVFAELFQEAGFLLHSEVRDTTRDTSAKIFYLQGKEDGR